MHMLFRFFSTVFFFFFSLSLSSSSSLSFSLFFFSFFFFFLLRIFYSLFFSLICIHTGAEFNGSASRELRQNAYSDLDVDDKDEVPEDADSTQHHAEEGIIVRQQIRVHFP